MIDSDLVSILLIAIGLSADCFAVALSGAAAKRDHSPLQVFRVSSSFGVFQALMPLLGWLAGRTIVESIAAYDHWVAFSLLALVGGRMLWESFHSERSQEREVDITRGFLLLTLSIATSIDALAVGLSFAFLHVSIALASATIGVVAFTATTIGFMAGEKASEVVGKRAEAFGGIILLAIAFRILWTHTM